MQSLGKEEEFKTAERSGNKASDKPCWQNSRTLGTAKLSQGETEIRKQLVRSLESDVQIWIWVRAESQGEHRQDFGSYALDHLRGQTEKTKRLDIQWSAAVQARAAGASAFSWSHAKERDHSVRTPKDPQTLSCGPHVKGRKGICYSMKGRQREGHLFDPKPSFPAAFLTKVLSTTEI